MSVPMSAVPRMNLDDIVEPGDAAPQAPTKPSKLPKMAAYEVGTATIENAFGLLRQVLGAAVEDRRIPRNPCEGVRLPRRKHADRGPGIPGCRRR